MRLKIYDLIDLDNLVSGVAKQFYWKIKNKNLIIIVGYFIKRECKKNLLI